MAPHVLIVDADSSVAQITSTVVRHITPDVTLATETTPERAWLSIRRRAPDILIVDPAPHIPAGLFLIQRCQQLQIPPAIVILTSVSTPLLRASAEQFGVRAYLEKPAELVRLIEQLRMLLDQAPERSLQEQIPEQPLWYLG